MAAPNLTYLGFAARLPGALLLTAHSSLAQAAWNPLHVLKTASPLVFSAPGRLPTSWPTTLNQRPLLVWVPTHPSSHPPRPPHISLTGPLADPRVGDSGGPQASLLVCAHPARVPGAPTRQHSPCPRCLLPGVTGPCTGSGEASQGPNIRAWAQGRTQVMAEAQHMHRPCARMISRWWEQWLAPQQSRECCRRGATGDELTGQGAAGTPPGSVSEGRAPDCLWGKRGGWLREVGSSVTGVWACGPQRDEGLQEEAGDADCGYWEERASKTPLC